MSFIVIHQGQTEVQGPFSTPEEAQAEAERPRRTNSVIHEVPSDIDESSLLAAVQSVIPGAEPLWQGAPTTATAVVEWVNATFVIDQGREDGVYDIGIYPGSDYAEAEEPSFWLSSPSPLAVAATIDTLTENKCFIVTVDAEGLSPNYSTLVFAEDEWKARTRTMITYPHSLRGEEVTYEIQTVNEGW